MTNIYAATPLLLSQPTNIGNTYRVPHIQTLDNAHNSQAQGLNIRCGIVISTSPLAGIVVLLNKTVENNYVAVTFLEADSGVVLIKFNTGGMLMGIPNH